MENKFTMLTSFLRFLYFPYDGPLMREHFFDVCWSLTWRHLAYYIFVLFFLVPGIFEKALVQWVALPLCMGLFWFPYISILCRRLQGMGFAKPYMGWPFFVVIMGVFLLYCDQFPFPSDSAHLFYVDLPLLLFIIPPDNPVCGVGVFSAKGPPEPEWRRPFQTWK